MSRQVKRICSWFLIASVLLSGCHPMQPFYLHEDGDLSHYLDVATEIEHADVDQVSLAEVEQARRPFAVAHPKFDEFWDLTLEDAISIALQNSKVVRRLRTAGAVGAIARSAAPDEISVRADVVPTIYDPALGETDPRFGVAQALANFDTQLSTSLFWDRTDRPQNFGDAFTQIFARLLRQDQMNLQTELRKQSASGAQFFARSITTYDDSSQTSRAVPSDWFQAIEFEARQPLLRQRGTQVNRIPVVIARIQTDIRLHDFEANVRNLVSDVERSYWDLYFSYYNLEATKIGFESALATWQRISALYQAGAAGGEAENEAQSREQFFFFRERVEEGQELLFKSENRLRYLLGLAETDGRLIRPADEPTSAKVTFEWNEVHSEALIRSPELRRHKWRIKQRELELIQARNLLLPQLDAVMLYRFLGLGDGLFTESTGLFRDQAAGTTAIDALTDGDFQEGRLGIQLAMPLGFRAELAQVRNRQLQLARDRAVLEEMELEVSHQVADTIQSLESLYKRTQSNLNRIEAARAEVEAIQAAYDAGTATLDRLLDAQRRRSDAGVRYFQTLADYNIAIANVHFRKGSLLEYNNVVLAEGPWPGKAYFDAQNLARRRDASYYLNYGFSRPSVVSRGPVNQTSEATADEFILESIDSDMAPFPDESDVDAMPELEPLPETEADDRESSGEAFEETSDVQASAPASQLGPALSPPVVDRGEQSNAHVRQVVHKEDAKEEAFDWGKLGLDKPVKLRNPAAAAPTDKPSDKTRSKSGARVSWKVRS